MPRAARQKSETSIYHIVTRGVSKQIIFEDDDDRAFFMKCVSRVVHGGGLMLIAWCLMDNHFHLVVKANLEQLSMSMHSLLCAYSGYFNRVHMRSGPLFEGRFKSESVVSDAHLLSVIRYVHMNPVKAGLSQSLHFPWSSYDEIISGSGWADSSFAMGMFNSPDEFAAFHEAQEKEFSFLDIGSGTKRRLTDKEAQNVAVDILGGISPHSVLQMNRTERDNALARMKCGGLSVRQIQRLTGLSVGTISKAGK